MCGWWGGGCGGGCGGGGGGDGCGGGGGGGVMVHSNKEEKSLRHIAMVAKFLDLKYFRFFLQVWQKKTKILDMCDFPVHDCTQEQNSSPYYPPSFDNTNSRLCQDQKLCHHGNVTSLLFSLFAPW